MFLFVRPCVLSNKWSNTGPNTLIKIYPELEQDMEAKMMCRAVLVTKLENADIEVSVFMFIATWKHILLLASGMLSSMLTVFMFDTLPFQNRPRNYLKTNRKVVRILTSIVCRPGSI